MNKLTLIASAFFLCTVSFGLGILFAKHSSQTVPQNVSIPVNAPSMNKIDTEAEIDKTPNIVTQIASGNTQQNTPSQSTSSYESTALKTENQALKSSLKELSAQFQKTSNRYEQAAAMLNQAGLEMPNTLSKEKIDSLIPAPFNNAVNFANPNFQDQFEDLHSQEQDYEWAIDLETRVQDFFAIHEYHDSIKLQRVTCKTNKCEIYDFHNDAAKITIVMQDLSKESWFFSIGTNSMSGDNLPLEESADMGGYFYVLTSMMREP